ncbi:MAG: hypothetical protein RJA07_1117 [Bacteroidota bacterium]|jgi:hypothetical protein
MKSKSIYLFLILIAVALSLKTSIAQTVLFQQNFDSIPQLTVPLNWANTLASNPNNLGWYVDSTNFSSGYSNSSGMQNLVIKNVDNSTGLYTVTSPSISTLGFKNITILWASRVSNNFTTSGSTTPNLFYSINNGASWNNISYTDNAANSTWALVNSGVQIALPIITNNKPSLQLKWEIQIDTASQGTYRIDDVQIQGFACSNSSSTTNASTCNGTPFLFNNNSYTTAGIHTTMLKNYLGCDSSANLNLTILQNSTTNIYATTCIGTPYIFNGNNYSTNGNYTIHLTNYVGCDSTITLHLSIKQNSTSVTNAATCVSVPYIFNGNAYTTAGSYTVHLINYAGCDSAATLNLSVKQNSTSITNAATCAGIPYIFNNNSYSTAGNYTIHLTNYVGCDSAAILNLSVSSTFTPSVNIAASSVLICSSTMISFTATPTNGGLTPTYQWQKNGINVGSNNATYNSNSILNGDIITCLMTSSLSCINSGSNPSTSNSITIHVLPSSSSTTYANICNGMNYQFNNFNYSSPGAYTIHLNNYVGCDSAATLILSTNQSSTSQTNATICPNQTYNFNGTNYNAIGNYSIHLINHAGCDSIANLSLNFVQISTGISATNFGLTCLAAQSNAQYQWIDCYTNTIIVGANSKSYTPYKNGDYRCIIKLNNCYDTTPCMKILGNVGLEEEEIPTLIKLTPNPTNGPLKISFNKIVSAKIILTSIIGNQLVEWQVYNEAEKTMDISQFTKGIYFIKIISFDEESQIIKIIKQ